MSTAVVLNGFLVSLFELIVIQVIMRMNLKMSVALIAFLFALFAMPSAQQNKTLEVKVYYEALCIDSMMFFIQKLYPSMKDKSRLQHTDLKLIPYGKVLKYENRTTKKTELYCQHGTRECELNALHACIIENNNISEALNVITCLMNGFRTDFDMCAIQYGVDVQVVRACTNSRTIPEILDVYGQQTSSIDLSFVPSVEIDKKFDYSEQYELRQHFDKMFCRKFRNKFNDTLEGCNPNEIKTY